MTTLEQQTAGVTPGKSIRSRLAWEDINVPGAYVSATTGMSYRITADSLVRGGSPNFAVGGDGGPFVRLSGDPHVTNQKLRLLAAEEDIAPAF